MTVPLSILDLSPISEGSDAATALRNTIDLAQHAEQWGYERYWIAEHHFVAVASSSPAVLIGQIAAATEHIHVGAGAVQLGHTTAAVSRRKLRHARRVLSRPHRPRGRPVRAAAPRGGEEARRSRSRDREPTTEWRDVDGVVVPPPFDMRTIITDQLRAQMSVLQQPEAVSPDFADQVDDILAMLNGCYRVRDYDVHAVPGERTGVDAVGVRQQQGAERAGGRRQRAAVRGQLPHHTCHRAGGDRRLPEMPSHRRRRCPSHTWWSRPTWWWPTTPPPHNTSRPPTATGCYSIRTGGGAAPLPRSLTPPNRSPTRSCALVKDRIATQFVGDPDVVAERAGDAATRHRRRRAGRHLRHAPARRSAALTRADRQALGLTG